MALITAPEASDLTDATTRLRSLLRLDGDGIANISDLCSALQTLSTLSDAVRARLERIKEEDDEFLSSLNLSDSENTPAERPQSCIGLPRPLLSRTSSVSSRTSDTTPRPFTPLSQRRNRKSCVPSFPTRPETTTVGGLRELQLVTKNRRNSTISPLPTPLPTGGILTRSRSPSVQRSSGSLTSPSEEWSEFTTLDTMLTSARRSLYRNRLDLPAASARRASMPLRQRSLSNSTFDRDEQKDRDQKLHAARLKNRNSMRALYRSDSPLARKSSLATLIGENPPDSTPQSPTPDDWDLRGAAPSSTDTRHSWDSGFAEVDDGTSSSKALSDRADDESAEEGSSAPTTPSVDDDASFSRLSTLLMEMQAEAEKAVLGAMERGCILSDDEDSRRSSLLLESKRASQASEPAKDPAEKRRSFTRQPTLDLEVLVQELVVLQRGAGMVETWALLAGAGVLWTIVGYVLRWGCNSCQEIACKL